MLKNKGYLGRVGLALAVCVSVLALFFAVDFLPEKANAGTPVRTCSMSVIYGLEGPYSQLTPEPYPGYYDRYKIYPGTILYEQATEKYYKLSASYNALNGFCDPLSFRNFKMTSYASYRGDLGQTGDYVKELDTGTVIPNPIPCPDWAESPYCSFFNHLRLSLINPSYYLGDGVIHSVFGSFEGFSGGTTVYLKDSNGSEKIRIPFFNGHYDLEIFTNYSFEYLCDGTWRQVSWPDPFDPNLISALGFKTSFEITGRNIATLGDGSLDQRYYYQMVAPMSADKVWIGCPSNPVNIQVGINKVPPVDASQTRVTGECVGSPTSGVVPIGVKWSAINVDGGAGPYVYNWEDDDTPVHTWTGQDKVISYTTQGDKTAALTIVPAVGLPSSPIYCTIKASAPVVGSLAGSCSKVTATNTPAISSPVTWQATGVSGGTLPYTYSWSGTDQATPSTDNPYIKSYSTVGVKTPTLTIKSADGQSIVRSCPSVTVIPSLNVVVVGSGTVSSVANLNLPTESADGNIASCSKTGGTACSHQYAPNEVVGLRASIPAGNSISWSGCDNLPDGAAGSSCSLTMNNNRTVTATFVQSVTAIDLTLSCPASVPYGTGPALSWNTSGNPDSCTASGAWTGSKTKNATNGPEVQSAITSDQTYTLTCAKAGTASVSSSCTVKMSPSQPVILVQPGTCGGKISVKITTPSQGFTSYTLNRLTGTTWSTVATGLTAADFALPNGYVKRLSPGAPYRYELVAVGSGGLNAYSDYSLSTSAGIASDSCSVKLRAF